MKPGLLLTINAGAFGRASAARRSRSPISVSVQGNFDLGNDPEWVLRFGVTFLFPKS